VGAAARVFTGCNVENAAYGDTICAERCAVLKAVSEGKREFRRIAIWAEGKNYAMPCGSCRQVLSEFSPEMEVLSAKAGGSYVSYPLSRLMPYAFSF
jgi:cytidine deaminase